MKVYYCDEWSDIKKQPWNILDDRTAYLHHQKHEPYTAVLTEDEKPKYIVNVTNEWVSVGFYDDLTRKYLNYDFEVISNNKIFLRTAMYWEYDDVTEDEVSSLILGFHEDGHIAMEKTDFKTGLVEERETSGSLERNWAVFPAFGEYIHLCREER
ncbi:hypothetical protein ACH95_18355 [Bacillus glycinifermentans]|uniref:hypothetical protein n=1 Tax=Bacillus glycinifermentans TaxID=1664069 RepID=UPI0006548226|nr:hypothetical protein [Bacillus glycinifermentans]KMM55887.1 hypothetical protein ACH95_18355 [Bacillus glycinifermentans]MEC0494928.1 hypothetical protein [Bacillus glycinifermentans]MEC0540929.1 hypothetical protein [Bacillus glycinifermentans]MEC3609271.1 hypothetical protein [Bacillus glycinifermentans]UOY89328.1 hypothetical protein MW696_03550 [Bacillus glycinifermentans]